MEPYQSYTPTLLASYFRVIDVLAQYSNTLGIVIADQLINGDDTLKIAPVIRSVSRDVKRYMKMRNEIKSQRILPVAYDAMSFSSRDLTVLEYLTTGDPSTTIDFWTVSISKSTR